MLMQQRANPACRAYLRKISRLDHIQIQHRSCPHRHVGLVEALTAVRPRLFAFAVASVSVCAFVCVCVCVCV